MGRGKVRTVIDGEAALVKKLRRLGSKAAAKRVLRGAAAKATTPLARAVRAHAPVDTGTLKKSIGKKTSMTGYVADSRVGAKSDSAAVHYQHLVEFGREASPAKPFLRPAHDAKEAEMHRIYREEVDARLRKEAKKK